MPNKQTITVETSIQAPVERVWEIWNEPEHIVRWCHASDDWEAPTAENDLRVGGTFRTVMAARDGSARFDFAGTYARVTPHREIDYVMADGRRVSVRFETVGSATKIAETFDPESENPLEMQRAGWQAILDNFARYAEKAAK
ncbi:MAG TPA: SRPBCC domain-containing protein [Candidatus Paceibacterota bacterium]|nr:SRPBCC domain-containing protein [Candidatus Paceibacterota bacterium]